MNISTSKKEIRLSFFNDTKLEEIVNSLFDETGRGIENASIILRRGDLDTFGIIQGLDDFKIRFESDKIKGLFDVRVVTNGNTIQLFSNNKYVIKTKKQKYSFY